MGKPVVHFEVCGGDGKRLQAFYRDLFEWRINADNPMNYGIVDTQSGGKGIAGGVGPAPARVTFYVEVADLNACLLQAKKLGATVVMEPSAVPGGPTIAMFKDPEGNVIGLVRG